MTPVLEKIAAATARLPDGLREDAETALLAEADLWRAEAEARDASTLIGLRQALDGDHISMEQWTNTLNEMLAAHGLDPIGDEET